jgi:hypothetical protein
MDIALYLSIAFLNIALHSAPIHITSGIVIANFHCSMSTGVVFHFRDFPFPNSRDLDDCFIPDFPGNLSGIPGNRIY